MRKKYFLYHGKYSNTYRIASAEDVPTVSALLSEGWERTTLAEVKALRRCQAVVNNNSIAYIDAGGTLVIVDAD